MTYDPDSISLRFFTSPEWQAWEEEVGRRMNEQAGKEQMEGVWDVDEARELGMMSEGHWNDFIKFVKQMK